jgi:hypothetical protein
MTELALLTFNAAIAGRWTARIVGTLMVLFILAFVLAETPPPLSKMTPREQRYAIGMGALFLGLVIAWFWEGWGGLLSLAAWALLSILSGRPHWDWPLLIPGAVGLLHLVCWAILRGPAPPPPALTPAELAQRKKLWILLWTSLAVFVLFCANEMFGMPPLMTPSGPVPEQMQGTWRGNAPGEIPAVLTVAADGSVSGSVGNAALLHARLHRNRSWFGRLMNWRTDWMMQGELAQPIASYGGSTGSRFSLPLTRRGAELDGSLFLARPGAPRPLHFLLRKQ